MYTNDKVCRVTLRLNQDQFDFVKRSADILGVSPSEFIRMVINSSLALEKATAEKLNSIAGGLGRANDKANCNNLV